MVNFDTDPGTWQVVNLYIFILFLCNNLQMSEICLFPLPRKNRGLLSQHKEHRKVPMTCNKESRCLWHLCRFLLGFEPYFVGTEDCDGILSHILLGPKIVMVFWAIFCWHRRLWWCSYCIVIFLLYFTFIFDSVWFLQSLVFWLHNFCFSRHFFYHVLMVQ